MSGPSVKLPVDWLERDHLEDLGADVVMLMITALGYSARQTTNGVVPRRRLRKLWHVDDTEKAIELLVDVDEVEDRGDDVYFTRWRDFILEADEVERMKATNRERTERSRRHQRGDHSMCRPSWCREAARSHDMSRDESRHQSRDSDVTVRVSDADPYRPDPTRPDLSGGERGKGRATAGRGSAGATPDPADSRPRSNNPGARGVRPTITLAK